MIRILILGVVSLGLTLILNTASAETIDFDGLGLAEGTIITAVPGFSGVTFNGAKLVLPGGVPNTGFKGNSTSGGVGGPDDANSGATITTIDPPQGIIEITFATPVQGLNFDVADIDIIRDSFTETIVARVYDAPVGGTQLHEKAITANDQGTGDGVLTMFDFSGGFIGVDRIQRLEIQTNSPVTGPGYAVDNLTYTFVPEPSSMVVWLAIGAITLRRRNTTNTDRKKSWPIAFCARPCIFLSPRLCRGIRR